MNPITEYLEQWYDEVEPKEFYRGVFPAGSLQQTGDYTPGLYNAIAVVVTDKKKPDGKTPVIKRYTITDDLNGIDDLCQSDYFTLMSPVSYAGKERTSENARHLYAIAVDVDLIRMKDGSPIGLMNLLERHIDLMGRIPKPTYIVSSGTGVHLYYVLEKPLSIFPEKVKRYQQFKFALTDLIWHDTIVGIKSKKEIQYEGIFQGFRVPGTITKRGDRARVFLTGEPVSIDYLNGFLPDDRQLHDYVEKGHLTLKAAKEKYPEWYERRIERKEPRGSWHVSRNVYDWWKRQIYSGAEVGHRYNCLRILAVYAQKCSMYDPKHNPDPVTREELERDCWELMEYLEMMTKSEDNHFDASDVMAALNGFDEKWITYPREDIEFKSGIRIPPNRRNGQKQEYHLEDARYRKRMMIKRNQDFKNPEGRPSALPIVTAWRKDNPGKRKADCIRETGLTRPTVKKYWDAADPDGAAV